MKVLAAMAGMAALLACSPQTQAGASSEPAGAQAQAPETAVHPVSGLAVVPLIVTSGEDRHQFAVEVADTREAQARGLMFRTELGDFEGMIFPYDGTRAQSFWMKNTWIPLDIGFFDSEGVLIEVRKLHPHEEESVKSTSRNILFAIELNRNGYRDANASLGAKLNLDDLKNALKARGINPEKHGL